MADGLPILLRLNGKDSVRFFLQFWLLNHILAMAVVILTRIQLQMLLMSTLYLHARLEETCMSLRVLFISSGRREAGTIFLMTGIIYFCFLQHFY
jgi:hypothetical protein